MFKKILVGYEGSEFSEAALNKAIELAKISDGKLFIVSVPDLNLEVKALAPELENQLTDKTQEYLDTATKKAQEAGVACEAEVKAAESAYKGIIEAADKSDVDLIVLGTHGHAGLIRLLMGSTTERVIGHATRDVLVVHSKK